MKIGITRVTTAAEVEAVAGLADEIWHEHFTPIIGLDQVEYMLEKFQSQPAILNQIRNGSEYFIAEIDKRKIGYTSLVINQPDSRLMISKIYLTNMYRGVGAGSQILEFIEREAIRRKLSLMWLTVNRNNHGPINWYKRNGFKIVDEVKKDIGNGYYMDDFIMERFI